MYINVYVTKIKYPEKILDNIKIRFSEYTEYSEFSEGKAGSSHSSLWEPTT